MQVLEMEEVESFIENTNRKRLGHANEKTTSKQSDMAACAIRSDFLSKLVVLSCLMLFGMLYMSTQSAQNDGGSLTVEDIEIKDNIPAPLPVENISSPEKGNEAQPKPDVVIENPTSSNASQILHIS